MLLGDGDRIASDMIGTNIRMVCLLRYLQGVSSFVECVLVGSQSL